MQPINPSFESGRGTVVLRQAAPADVVPFRDLRLSALLDNPTAFSADYQVNLNAPMSFWEGRLNFDEYGTIFFALHDSNLIGMTGVRKGESPKTKHSAMIWGVYVRPQWRGLHIAEALIEACAEWAQARDVKILKLGVITSNTSAVQCYTRCGFTTYGTEPQAIRYEDTYYDEYLMFRNIA